GSLPLKLQGKLLRTLQEKEIERLGGNKLISVDVRIIAASNCDLRKEIEKGNFRQDLFYRLNVVPIHIPPLRERKEDIVLLIDHCINKFNREFGKDIEGMSKVGLSYLLNYDWPGNIRELENIIKAAVALSEKPLIWLEDIPFKISLTGKTAIENTIKADYSLNQAEKEHILRVLNMCRWNKSKTAKLLKISRPRLDRKIEEYKLKKP
ncbi:sigma 54-interacting transcriptional regulator, partial [bacterium]|nr:sigma 54-interacting transcriptional regulator [bacterium]